MPELPEVETVVRILSKSIVGKTFNKVEIFHDKIIKGNNTTKTFTKKIIGQKIIAMNRMGKHILFMLDDFVFVSHLRMEGKYFVVASNQCEEINMKHIMVTFTMDDGSLIMYSDTRKFGTMHLLEKKDYKGQEPLVRLGLEPWDKKMSVAYLKEIFKRKRQVIKPTLLDQTIFVGLGNIYVDEVLFRSRISPTTPTNEITKKQIQLIIDNSKAIMDHAIKLGGTSVSSYTSSLGVTGRFQNELQVHTKKGCPCIVCGEEILKTKVSGRGTYYCPKCQKNK